MTLRHLYEGILAAAVLVLLAAQSRAADGDVAIERSGGGSQIANGGAVGWTVGKMESAMPLPLPHASTAPSPQPIDALALPVAVESGPSSEALTTLPPGVVLWPGDHEIHFTDSSDHTMSEYGALPHSSGTSGCLFSSSRLVPPTSNTKYPNRMIGTLFFNRPGGGSYMCSAAVLRPRVVLTAGHCVHQGSGGAAGFYTDFIFCPAYQIGASRYGCWTWNYVATTSDWANSGGYAPNAADYAMIEMADQNVSGQTTRIGDLLGWFGYATSSLTSNHVDIFGYPGNLDAGNRPHKVGAQRCASGGSNTELYGSDMEGGSSGGPFVQDFGALSNGQALQSPAGPNLIVGVVSYGSVSTEPKRQGASIFDTRFTGLLSTVCAHRSGNC